MEPTTSPVATIKWLTERERAEGKNVEVNPCALREDRLVLARPERLAILNKAIAGLGDAT